MNRNQTISFDCPTCHEEFGQLEELDEVIRAGRTYHCSACGGRVVFKTLTVEDYAATANRRTDCPFCKPNPLYIHPYQTTYSRIEKED